MPKNDIQILSPTDLVLLANQMGTVLGAGATNPYGVPADQKAALLSTTTALTTLNTGVEAAKAAYHAATRNRETGRAACAAAAAIVARTAYANPAVTPGMVSALGLSPRSTSRARILPVTPIKLTATPVANGDLRLEWDRFGNATGVNFVIEAKVGAGDWSFVQDTTAARITFSGYAPGTAVAFRVSASKNGVISAPTPATTIYPASALPALRLAA